MASLNKTYYMSMFTKEQMINGSVGNKYEMYHYALYNLLQGSKHTPNPQLYFRTDSFLYLSDDDIISGKDIILLNSKLMDRNIPYYYIMLIERNRSKIDINERIKLLKGKCINDVESEQLFFDTEEITKPYDENLFLQNFRDRDGSTFLFHLPFDEFIKYYEDNITLVTLVNNHGDALVDQVMLDHQREHDLRKLEFLINKGYVPNSKTIVEETLLYNGIHFRAKPNDQTLQSILNIYQKLIDVGNIDKNTLVKKMERSFINILYSSSFSVHHNYLKIMVTFCNKNDINIKCFFKSGLKYCVAETLDKVTDYETFKLILLNIKDDLDTMYEEDTIREINRDIVMDEDTTMDAGTKKEEQTDMDPVEIDKQTQTLITCAEKLRNDMKTIANGKQSTKAFAQIKVEEQNGKTVCNCAVKIKFIGKTIYEHLLISNKENIIKFVEEMNLTSKVAMPKFLEPKVEDEYNMQKYCSMIKEHANKTLRDVQNISIIIIAHDNGCIEFDYNIMMGNQTFDTPNFKINADEFIKSQVPETKDNNTNDNNINDNTEMVTEPDTEMTPEPDTEMTKPVIESL